MSATPQVLIPEPPQPQSPPSPEFDVYRVRADFPILSQPVQGKRLAYLDNAATAQKPQAVIDALTHYYTFENSNVHRGVHHLSQVATDAYEGARRKIRTFINAAEDREIIYVRGTTEGINLLARTFGKQQVQKDDEIVISAMEHHSNIVPWLVLCQEVGARLRVIPMNDRGELLLEKYEKLLTPRTKLVSVVHISNVLGTVNPVQEIVRLAHQQGIPVHVDGAQSAPHMKVDVQQLDCDFFTLSGHKLFGPTGIGVLYGKRSLLEAMPPYEGGGSMIQRVTFDTVSYADLPNKYEAGTPNIAGAVGLGAAVDYLEAMGMASALVHEADLLDYALEALSEVPGLRIIGTAEHKISVLSFMLGDVHPHDIGTILDQEGVAVRAGHHCAQPIMQHFGIPAATRASMAFYNTREDIDALVGALHKVLEVFG